MATEFNPDLDILSIFKCFLSAFGIPDDCLVQWKDSTQQEIIVAIDGKEGYAVVEVNEPFTYKVFLSPSGYCFLNGSFYKYCTKVVTATELIIAAAIVAGAAKTGFDI